jgi:phage baseplate assembly protein W
MVKINITDLSTDFSKSPITGDIPVKKDGEAIKQSLRNLLLMNQFDKPFNPELSAGLRSLLFENFPDEIRRNIIREKVEYIISTYEPRVLLQNVDVLSFQDENLLTVQITYKVVNQENLQVQSLVVNLERNR